MANKIKESNITEVQLLAIKLLHNGTVITFAWCQLQDVGAPATITTGSKYCACKYYICQNRSCCCWVQIFHDAITTTQISPTAGIVSGQIAPGTIANDRLANTGITINGTTIALGASGDIVAGTDWQSVITADGSTATTAVAGAGYFIDTTSATHTVNLPASPTQGDEVTIVDYAGTFGTNNVTLEEIQVT
jgi:hypothetical protein